jgi:hypothetical protein
MLMEASSQGKKRMTSSSFIVRLGLGWFIIPEAEIESKDREKMKSHHFVRGFGQVEPNTPLRSWLFKTGNPSIGMMLESG